jgi:hypothetical protein
MSDFETRPRPRRFETIESWIGGAIGLVMGAIFIVFCVMLLIDFPDSKLRMPRWGAAPLLAASVLFDGWFILTVYRCLGRRELPLGPALAMRQRQLPAPLRLLQAAWWLARVVILVLLAFRLEQVLGAPAWKSDADSNLVLIILTIFVFGVTFTANLYMMLTVSAFTRNAELLDRIWRYRLALDGAITIAALIFGQSAH